MFSLNKDNAEMFSIIFIVLLIGAPMTFSNFVKDEPKGNPYLHMNFDAGFAWDTKDDANDQDNGFICKKQHTA